MTLGNESSRTGEARPLLRLAGLRKSYDAVHALRWDDDSVLDVRAGEVLGVIGENGAGKSTLLGLLTGAIKADSGTIELAGEPYHASGPFDALHRGVALIPQETLLSPTLTVAENALLGREREYATFGVVNGRRRDRLARAALAEIGLDLPLPAIVRGLPIEQQKLIELARALAAGPTVLLVDETSNVLGHEGVELLFERVHRLAAGGRGVVIVSHNLDEIREHCDRIAVLRDGQLIETVDNDESITTDGLARSMVGRSIRADNAASRHTARGAEALRLEEVRGASFGPISLTVHAGEIVGVGGLVGCGAQELARTIAGDLMQRGGSMHVAGRPPRRHSVRALLDAGVVYVPKDRDAEGLLLSHSVRDNLSLASLRQLTRMAMVWPRTGVRECHEIGRRMHLRAASHRVAVETLSGGNRQKVLLGKAIMCSAALMVFDNPTRGVDIAAKKEIYDVIREMRAEGAAVLLISDELSELRRLVDRLIIMRRGKVTATHVAPLPTEHDLIGDMV